MNARLTLAVAEKEFLENVLSWRFLIALVIGTLILVTSVLALGASYAEDRAAFTTATSQMERDGNEFTTSQLELTRVLGRPNPLAIFVGGPGDDMRRAEPTGPAHFVVVGSGGGAGDVDAGSASPTNQRFTPVDLGFVAVVVMTFMAIMFSYDAVSGERERGTLKLMLANPLPKDVILVGKYLGGLASILLPFSAALLIALAVLQVRGVTLTGEEWARLGVIILLLAPLVSAFYLLGLAVSSLVKRSQTSLLALALVWLVLVFGAGNVAAVVAKETVATIGHEEVEEAFTRIDDRTSARVEALNEEIFALYERRAQNNGTLSAEDQARLDALEAERSAAFEDAQAERDTFLEDAKRRLDAQLQRAESIAAFSPAEAFRNLATSLARSDYWSYRDAADAADEYRREVQRAWEDWNRDNQPATQSFTGDSAEPGMSITWGGPDGPRFQPPLFPYEAPAMGAQLASPGAVRDLLVLVAYNVLGFAAAYVAFVRYDVR